MSDASFTASASKAEPSLASTSDFFALMKPRVMSLVVFTALVGMVMAPVPMHPLLAVVSLVMIAVGAGASGALNMWYDAEIDAKMTRTRGRPIPTGRVTRREALSFGLVLSAGSVLILGLVANWLAAGLLAFTIAFYVLIYTMWLKTLTPQNIVIGGAAGAFPPMIGWAAVSGDISLASVVLFLIIFLWTPPHFWALALYRSGEYEKVGIPMLPVVEGPDETRRQILLYTLIYLPVTLAPPFIGAAGFVYGLGAGVLAAIFLVSAVRVYRLREGEAAEQAAKHLFAFSILQLLLLFALLLVEHGFGWHRPFAWLGA